MAIVVINGETYSGNNVSISNGQVVIDGVAVKDGRKLPRINIEIEGDVESIDVDVCNILKIQGNAGSVKTTSGDVMVGGNVSKDVKCTSGDVSCNDVGGSVETSSGDITCSAISGNARTRSGDIDKRL